MTFIFKDFVVNLFSYFVNSMTNTCCAPTTDVKDLQLQDPQESKLRDIAKMSTLDDNESNHHDQSQLNRKHPHHPHLDINDRDFLLISGFLHHILAKNTQTQTTTHTNLHFDLSPIRCLCISYYYTLTNHQNYIYLLAEHSDTKTFPSLDSDDDADDLHNEYLFNNYGVYISHTLAPMHKYCANIYELAHTNKLSIFTEEWIVKFAALCSTKNILLPCGVHSDIIKAYKRTNLQRNDNIMREYNIMFKLCGSGTCGWSDVCTAVVIDEGHLHNSAMEEIIGFNWHLPAFPIKTGGNGVCFDAKYGLLSVGGYQSDKVYNLSFGGEAYFEQNYAWIWEQLPAMREIRWFPSCCVVNDKLIAMAGSSADHDPLCSVEWLDLNGDGDGEWRGLSSCNIARKFGGLIYDNMEEKLYLGGGDYATQSVEYYDVCKDKWYNLPNTQLPHKYYPSLWKDVDAPNVVNICCSYSNSIESYDLRTNDKKWKLVCANKVFQTDSLDLDYNQFRLCL